MGIIEDALGFSLAWKMVVIWLDEGWWGPPPRLEQTGAEEPRAGCINEQAVLEGTGSCNADEWSLQSRDERREQKGERGEEEKSTAKRAQLEQRWKKGLICTSDFCKLVYHVSSVTVFHVSSLRSLSLPLPDPNLLVFSPWYCHVSLGPNSFINFIVYFRTPNLMARMHPVYLYSESFPSLTGAVCGELLFSPRH